MKQILPAVLAALIATACGAASPTQPSSVGQSPVTTTPLPAAPSPTVDQPPAVNSTPVPPRRAWCDTAAGVLYQEIVTGQQRNKARAAVLTIRARGSWNYTVAGKLIKRGCLARRVHKKIIRALTLTNFASPPPFQGATCAAVPSTFITYRDLIHSRTARSATPCGMPANPAVHRLTKLIHTHVGPSPGLQAWRSKVRPVRGGKTCLAQHVWGKQIYSERTSSYRLAGPRPKRIAPYRTLTIWSNGAWLLWQNRVVTKGCVSAADMGAIRSLVKRARFRHDLRPVARCQAMPSATTTIAAGSKSVTFDHPCGADIDPSLGALRSFVLKSARP